MKVILLQDVAKIGKRFEVTNVPDGYALNQLIPKRMAEPATPANLKKIERRQAEAAASKEAGQSRFEAAKAALAGTTLKIEVEANEQGHLFKAVHEDEVAAAAVAAGAAVDATMFKIAAPIKELGEHTVALVSGEATADITIEVVKK